MKYYLLFLSIVLCCVACTASEQCEGIRKIEAEQNNQVSEPSNETVKLSTITRIDTLDLKVFYPEFSKVDLVCGIMPSKEDESVMLVMAAAYTGQCLKEFKHSNIVGMHVSGGKLYNAVSNYGAFVYYNGKWKFVCKEQSNVKTQMQVAAQQGGAGFSQELLIYNGKIQKTNRGDKNKNLFRALCQHNGRLCVIESQTVLAFGDFKKKLQTYGVTHAIYTDMGSGWNHAWYRSETGIVELQPYKHPYCTNWITFYR